MVRRINSIKTKVEHHGEIKRNSITTKAGLKVIYLMVFNKNVTKVEKGKTKSLLNRYEHPKGNPNQVDLYLIVRIVRPIPS